jgi:hypothetical protein
LIAVNLDRAAVRSAGNCGHEVAAVADKDCRRRAIHRHAQASKQDA